MAMTILGIIISSGCGKKPKQDNLLRADGYLNISADSGFHKLPYYSDIQSWNGEEVIFIVQRESNRIIGYSLSDNSEKYRYSLSALNIGDVRTFHFSGIDSVFIYTKSIDLERQLFLYKPSSQSVTAISYSEGIHLPGRSDQNKIVADSAGMFETLDCSYRAPVYYSKGVLFANILPYEKLSDRPDSTRDISFEIQLSSEMITRHPVHHPQCYYHHKMPYDFTGQFSLVKGDSIIISFPGSDDVFIYDRATLQTSHVNLHSDSVLAECITISEPPTEALIKYGYYGRIFWHPHQRKFIRLVYGADSYYQPSTEKYLTFDERKCIIQVFDEGFYLLQELVADKGASERNAFCTKTGFWVLSPLHSVFSADQHVLSYAKYTF